MVGVDLALLESVILVGMGGWLIVLGGAFLMRPRPVDRVSAVLLMLAGVYAILWQEPALFGLGEAIHVAIAQPVFLLFLSGAVFLWTYWLFERHVTKLESTRDELSESLELERTLVDVLSHDLRNPIAAAHLNVQTIAENEPELADELEPIQEDLSRAADVMADGLVYSQLSMGEEVPETEMLDLVELVDEAVDHCLSRAERRAIQLRHEESGPVAAQVSPILERAVENLVDNAIKFSPDGGTVTVRTHADLDDAVVSVTDEGPGMDAEERERFFDRFEHGAEGQTGSGLGLAIVQRLVDLQDGEIDVESRPGEGTTVTIRVPSPDEDQPTGPANPDPAGTVAAQRRGSA